MAMTMNTCVMMQLSKWPPDAPRLRIITPKKMGTFRWPASNGFVTARKKRESVIAGSLAKQSMGIKERTRVLWLPTSTTKALWTLPTTALGSTESKTGKSKLSRKLKNYRRNRRDSIGAGIVCDAKWRIESRNSNSAYSLTELAVPTSWPISLGCYFLRWLTY